MRAGGPPGESVDGASGVGLPVGCAEARERGDDVDAARVGDALGQVLGLGRVLDDSQLVSEPLDEGASHEDRALERVLGALDLRRRRHDRGHEVIAALARLVTRVKEHEAARPVGVLRLTGLEAALSEECRLLVAGDARDGDARGNPGVARLSEGAARTSHLGHHARGNVKEVEKLLVPAALVDVVEHRAARVGDVGRMHEPAREHPDEPGVDGAEEQLARLRAFAGARDVPEDPRDLARREVRVRDQAGLRPDAPADLGGPADLVDDGRRAPALPHDGVVDRLPRGGVPDDGGLALVVDADRVDLRGGEVVFVEELGERPDLREEDVLRVVLDPSRMREDLLERPLHAVDHAPLAVDEYCPR